jgi:hypothetical protein
VLKLLVEVGFGRETAQIIALPDAQLPNAVPDVLHETAVKNPASCPEIMQSRGSGWFGGHLIDVPSRDRLGGDVKLT